MIARDPPDLDEEDAAMWRELARSVKPLAVDRAEPKAAPTRKLATKPAPLPAPVIRAAIHARPVVHPPYVPPTSVAAGAAARPGGIDEKTAQAIARGSLPIGGRLDLHGMTEAQAHAALIRLVENAARNGVKTLLVITGKGERLGGALRAAVPRWLAERPLSGLVAGIRPAEPRHGAEGAYYVRLRGAGRRTR